jgi:molybdate transport system permease protein
LKTGAVAALLAVLPGTFFAVCAGRASRGWRSVLDGIFTLPLLLPPVVPGFFLLAVCGITASKSGNEVFSWEVHMLENWQGLLVAAFVIALPLMYRNVRMALSDVDENLFYVGETLGMRRSSLFFKVILPVAGPKMAVGTAAVFVRAMGEYGVTSMLVKNTAKTQTLSLAIAAETASGNYFVAFFWCIAITVVLFAALLLFNIFSGRGMKARRWI